MRRNVETHCRLMTKMSMLKKLKNIHDEEGARWELRRHAARRARADRTAGARPREDMPPAHVAVDAHDRTWHGPAARRRARA